jgi:hypothetical protein
MRFVYLVALFLIAGCSPNDDFTPVYEVPKDIQPLIDSFIHEASIRGVSISITNLIITYDDNPASSVCGSCNSSSLAKDVQKIITLKSQSPCWIEPLELETLLFHELGHCVLGRAHTIDLLPNGDPKSIMVENDIGIYAPCLYPIEGEPCDNSFKRFYYLDELFDETTPVPDWAD